jgi:hypothetical protein
MNNWIEHIRSFAAANNLSYGCALSDPECSASYRKKYPKKEKKSDLKKELASRLSKPSFVLAEPDSKDKENRERFKMTSEDISSKSAREKERTQAEKDKQEKEGFFMEEEDVNQARKKVKKVKKAKPKVELIIEEDEPEVTFKEIERLKTKNKNAVYKMLDDGYPVDMSFKKLFKISGKDFKELNKKYKIQKPRTMDELMNPNSKSNLASTSDDFFFFQAATQLGIDPKNLDKLKAKQEKDDEQDRLSKFSPPGAASAAPPKKYKITKMTRAALNKFFDKNYDAGTDGVRGPIAPNGLKYNEEDFNEIENISEFDRDSNFYNLFKYLKKQGVLDYKTI